MGVSDLVAAGDLPGALALAYEAQRVNPSSLPSQRRYHRLLLLSDKTATLLDHGRRFIAQLVRKGQASEALRVYLACKARDASFTPDQAGETLALAKHAWQGGDARGALTLINGFDKRFRGDPLIEQAYELAVRALVQGLNRRDMAQPIAQMLEKNFPDSESTREVQWLLREDSAQPPG